MYTQRKTIHNKYAILIIGITVKSAFCRGVYEDIFLDSAELIKKLIILLQSRKMMVGGKGFSSEDTYSSDFEPLVSGTFYMCHRVPFGDKKDHSPLPNPESYHSSPLGN